MKRIPNYIMGQWLEHSGEGYIQYNAITGEAISTVGSEGLDFAAMADYARKVGNPALRKMTFHQRGQMITEQMIYLFSQDQQIILDKIKPIVEYNYKLMIETDWYGDFFK